MNKGRWAIVVVLLVAVGMGVATWPLLRIRRKNEIHKTEAILDSLAATCKQYRAQHGHYPKSLGEARDAWGRPIEVEWVNVLSTDSTAGGLWMTLRSLGPNPKDPGDDLKRSLPPVP